MQDRIEIKDERKINFTIVENEIIDNVNLRPTEKLVYIALCRFAYHGECHPSTAKIAEIAGVSRRTVFRVIKKLCELGLVSKQRRKSKNQGDTSNIYTIHGTQHPKATTPYDKMSYPLCHGDIPPMTPCHTPYDTMSPKEYLIEEYLIEENILTCGAPKNAPQAEGSPPNKNLKDEKLKKDLLDARDEEVVSYLYKRFKEEFSMHPSSEWFAKQRKIVRSLLKRYTLEELKEAVDFALQDSFWRGCFPGFECFERVYQKMQALRTSPAYARGQLRVVGGDNDDDDLFVRTI